MDVRRAIKSLLSEKGAIKTSDIVEKTGFTRAYINRFLTEMREESEIVLIGRANKAHYIPANRELISQEREKVTKTHTIRKNTVDLRENDILDDISLKTGIFSNISENIADIINYTFLEIVNNAIEHSASDMIDIYVERTDEKIRFRVNDKGIGIFNNIMEKKGIPDYNTAVAALMKGRITTDQEHRGGEGIFFASKCADVFVIQSARKKIIYNNLVDDVFLRSGRYVRGTKVMFTISLDSARKVDDIFKTYMDGSRGLNKTEVIVRLYDMGNRCISRGQARRIMNDLEKFEKVVLDFKDIRTIGQGFADEVFRIWERNHAGITIETKNTNADIEFMIDHVRN